MESTAGADSEEPEALVGTAPAATPVMVRDDENADWLSEENSTAELTSSAERAQPAPEIQLEPAPSGIEAINAAPVVPKSQRHADNSLGHQVEAGLQQAAHHLPGMDWVQSLDRCKGELEARKLADELAIVYWGPIAKNGALGPDPCFWPWPKADQRVMLSSCCESWIREMDAEGKEDPLNHHGIGCWWFSWIVFGADPKYLVDMEKAGHMQPVLDKFGWELPPFGLTRNYNPFRDVAECGQGLQLKEWKEAQCCPINHLTMFNWGLQHCMRHLFEWNGGKAVYLTCLGCFMAVIPAIGGLAFNAAVPINVKPDDCTANNNLVYALIQGPLVEVGIAFCHFQCFVAAVDDYLPWRPFRMYWHLLVSQYVVQACAYLILIYGGDRSTIYFWGLYTRLIGLLCTMVWACIFQKSILCYDLDPAKVLTEPTAEKAAKFKAFCKYLIVEYLYILLAATYIYLMQVWTSDFGQSFLNFMYMVIVNFYRVALQHICDVMHKDMNFILAFCTVYGYYSLVTAFMSPEFGTNFKAFITASLEPISTIGVAMMHQSYIWFRFRCWVKKVYEPVLMGCFPSKRNNVLAWPLSNDYNPNGRGSSTAHAEYRRTKIHYDLIKMLSLICGYLVFLLVTPALRYGVNKRNFPYSERTMAETNGNDAGWEWSDGDYVRSIIYCGFVFVWLVVFMAVYVWYIKKYFRPLIPIMYEFITVFYRQPYKLSVVNMLLSGIALTTIKLYASPSNVWWFSYYHDGNGHDCNKW